MAVYANLTVDQGSAFEGYVYCSVFGNTSVDLTNYTVRAQLRRTYRSTDSIPFTASIYNVTKGIIKLALTSAQTDLMTARRYVYDVEVVDSNNNVARVVEGQIEVNPRVTRA